MLLVCVCVCVCVCSLCVGGRVGIVRPRQLRGLSEATAALFIWEGWPLSCLRGGKSIGLGSFWRRAGFTMPLWRSFKSLSVSWHLSQLRTRWTPVANAQTVAGGGTRDFNCRNAHPAFFHEDVLMVCQLSSPFLVSCQKFRWSERVGSAACQMRGHAQAWDGRELTGCSSWPPPVKFAVSGEGHEKGGVKICLFISLYHKCCWTVTEKLFCERKWNISQLKVCFKVESQWLRAASPPPLASFAISLWDIIREGQQMINTAAKETEARCI